MGIILDKRIPAVLALIVGAGCATAGQPVQPFEPLRAEVTSTDLKKGEEVSLDDLSDQDIKDLAADVKAVKGPTEAPSAATKIEVENNDQVKRWVAYFAEQEHERFARFLDRGNGYREVVQKVLTENGVPPELYYLAMIESGYSSGAVSKSRAVGTWQFMVGTSHRYGLRSDTYVDERRDPIRSTEAAAKYLRDLHNVFQSWPLAIAAYNSGEYRIINAIMRGKTRDFWELARKNQLPKETMDYVPKFFAATLIGRDPAKYGFSIGSSGEGRNIPVVEAVEVPSPLQLAELSRQSGIPLADLEHLNPHLRLGMTPPNGSSYELWIPKDKARKVKDLYLTLANYRVKNLRTTRAVARFQEDSRFYTVRQGDTLNEIARRNRVSVAYIKKVNGLGRRSIMAGQKLRMVAKNQNSTPVISAAARADVAAGRSRVARAEYIAANSGANASETSSASTGSPRHLRYQVRKGDNLFRIAQKFKIPVRLLKQENRIRGNSVRTGQVLRVAVRDRDNDA